MIHDLDKSLQKLLELELAHLESVDISFDTPENDYGPQQPTVNLFLYDIRENRELRSSQWRVERADGTARKIRPPVRVDCSFLVTAWAGTDKKVADQHRLLGEVMKALLRHPTLPSDALQGSLQDQEPPLPTSALQPGYLQSMGEFWQALGGKPKAALNYMVTIGVNVHEPVELGPVVTDKWLKFRQITEQE